MSWKTKFDVHWAPSVKTCTPGWTVAWPTGAQAAASEGNAATGSTAISETEIATFRIILGLHSLVIGDRPPGAEIAYQIVSSTP
jgi:hypothetical protein